MVFLFASFGCNRRFVYFLVQTRVVAPALVFRLRLFPGGLASGAGINRFKFFPLLPSRGSFSVSSWHGSACVDWSRNDPCCGFVHTEKVVAAIDSLCRTVAYFRD